ncbi:helix-turn-helix domain-containing protein, partial [Novosphingobium sp. 17-62-19]|uniref:helix-turn-helix domain-containing protein n=1 Tax=Novosphingobium sp. 17-62-19 TaxID=1970406 RepID=UPI0025FC7AA6
KLTGHYSALSISACPVSFATGRTYTTYRDTTLELHETGLTGKEIARQLFIHERMVYRVLREHRGGSN